MQSLFKFIQPFSFIPAAVTFTIYQQHGLLHQILTNLKIIIFFIKALFAFSYHAHDTNMCSFQLLRARSTRCCRIQEYFPRQREGPSSGQGWNMLQANGTTDFSSTLFSIIGLSEIEIWKIQSNSTNTVSVLVRNKSLIYWVKSFSVCLNQFPKQLQTFACLLSCFPNSSLSNLAVIPCSRFSCGTLLIPLLVMKCLQLPSTVLAPFLE